MTASLQFIHLNGYGRTPGRGCKSHETILGVTAEAARIEGHAPHIQCPNEPRMVYGISPIDVGQEAIRLSFLAKDCIGRRLKSDGVVLVAGVATYPIPIADMGGFVSDRDVYNLWVTRTLEWLSKEHEGLRSVVEHTDEGHLHLHFYSLPLLRPDGQLNFAPAHPGRRALKEARERRVEPAVQQAAYTNEMVAWQDRYYLEVSKFFGHDRYGPRRQRVDRVRHKANREATKHVSRIRAELELEYRVDVSEDEAEVRTSRVSEVDFFAVAVAKQQEMQREIDRLRAALRAHGIVEGNVTAPPPDLRPSGSCKNASEAEAMPLEIEVMPTPAPWSNTPSDSDLWTPQRVSIEAKADELVSRLVGKSNLEPPESEQADKRL
jgi:hypothetical protein